MKTKIYLKSLKLSFSVVFFIGICISYACQSSAEKELQYIAISSQEAYSYNYSEWDSLQLLVPQIGCSSCINQLIEKYKEQKIKTKLAMIGVSRERDLRLNYGQDFLDNPSIEIRAEIKHEPIAHDCFERPALLLFKSDTIHYFCFKTDEVNDVISYLSNHE
ncbi:hypothetical protein [Algoriphagus sp. Y33]|uniref:hypothetical protein n=1 Tax=Algoriphagus sp. Y33 TaxID=2772483 RepID=UPI00177DC699|nr:hypothetical protein [Algoriphagus sp. Y33]